MDLTPIGEPPSRSARWCPRCQCWYPYAGGRRRCAVCAAAFVRPTKVEEPRPGELRPGVVAEFADIRDRYDPSRELAELRARLTVKAHEVLGS